MWYILSSLLLGFLAGLRALRLGLRRLADPADRASAERSLIVRRALGVLAGLTLLATATAACRDGRADTAPTSTTAAPTSTTIGSVPTVLVLDPGAEPRSPLRIRYTPGDTVTIDLTVDQAIDQSVRQGDLDRPQRFDSPPITQGLTYRVGTVDDQNRATFEVEITSAEARTEGTELSPEASLLLQAELQPLVGLTGEGRVDDRGVVDQFTMVLPDDLDPELSDQIAELDRQLRSFGPSLPLEAVGTGARWEITSVTTIAGIATTTTTTYTLTEQTVDAISYTATISGTAEPQPLDLADQAASATLSSSTATGASTGTQSLDGLGFTLRTEVSTVQAIRLDGPDGSATLDQTIETDLAARTGTP